MKRHTEATEDACYLDGYDGLWVYRECIKWCHRQLEPRFKKKKLCKNNFDITVPKPKWNIQMGNKRLYLSRSTFSGIRIKTNAPNPYLISYIN